eukprot:scaffold662369_cov59-Prasinocladus_malaysianus.AAC.1
MSIVYLYVQLFIISPTERDCLSGLHCLEIMDPSRFDMDRIEELNHLYTLLHGIEILEYMLDNVQLVQTNEIVTVA